MTATLPAIGRWEAIPFRYAFSRLKRPVESGAGIVTAYTDGEVTLRSNRAKERYHEAKDLSTFQGVMPGDFVVHGLDIMRGSIGVSDSAGAMSPVCTVCLPNRGIDANFMAYAMRVQAAAGLPKAYARGVRDGGADFRRWETLAELPLPNPPAERQRRIADYLDRETATIDALIEKQQELVGGLRQRRTAVIVRWTTGERVEGERQSSSASWLQELPARWREEPLKRVFPDLQTGFWGADEAGDESDIRVVRVADFDRPTLSVGAAPTIRSVSASERARASLCREDLLMEKSGGTGKNPVGFVVAYDSDEESIYANFIVRLRPRSKQDRRFWLYALNGSYTSGLTWKSVNQTTGIQNLDMTSFMSEVFPVPPLEEQREIADYLDRETAKIDALIAKAERFIELAQERRVALITAAVTGQIEIPTED